MVSASGVAEECSVCSAYDNRSVGTLGGSQSDSIAAGSCWLVSWCNIDISMTSVSVDIKPDVLLRFQDEVRVALLLERVDHDLSRKGVAQSIVALSGL